MFLLSLDEIDRVKRAHKISTFVELEAVTGVTRKTWREALATRDPKPAVLQALARLGARPNRILVNDCTEIPAA
ncbi:XRE family transcriptional regulator [Corynebacterium lizhenjunii]|uniref:XRE family transcriptional regulator n=1 Tax=Corynebacterium lizhenjunii TaxID=2709394 RepID=A0A7T0KDW5_9CORY|nr:XRE family transcriptional regulator [Corynebacterium lizhenjunii]QPK78309.1 XRE family transcriptional regulator [Corynebacterium lizhenjunii]